MKSFISHALSNKAKTSDWFYFQLAGLLARLIGEMLDLASSEAGQLHVLHERLDLTEVLQVAAKIGGELAHEKGLTWSAQLPPRGPWVMEDCTRLRQVTLNQISNDVEFTSQKSQRKCF